MSGLSGFKARNHPQQTAKRGPSLFGDDETDATDDRATPQEFFDNVAKSYGGFTVDVAASPANAKCERFYTTSDNALEKSWAGERVWCNPPYSDIGAWVRKAWTEYRSGCDLIVMLLPANRTEQPWWQENVELYHDRGQPLSVQFIGGRLRFIQTGRRGIEANERPPFGVCLLIWERRAAHAGIGGTDG